MVTVSRDFLIRGILIIYNDIYVNCPKNNSKALIRKHEAGTPAEVKKSYV